MSRAWGLAVMASLLFACTEAVPVLGPAPEAPPDPRLPLLDAGNLDAPDLPDPPASATGCPGCGPGALCSAGGCVDTAGPTSLDSGRIHTCLVSDGRLYCWGGNSSGQLGLGDTLDRFEPTRVGAQLDWLAVSGGEAHSCALRAPGTLYCWGDNAKGQLGLGDTGKRLAPERVGEGDDWAAVACGGDNCCALRDAGRLYCWGDNLEGKPGQADGYSEPDVLEPREVAGEHRFAAVALGQGHVIAIDDSGRLLAWGRNVMGETGTGAEDAHLRAPTTIELVTPDAWVSVAASQHHSCGVGGDGSLWCWGTSPFGELGAAVVAEPASVKRPTRVGTESRWAAVAAGWFHTCAVDQDQALFCWGRAIEGQLGQGGGEPVPKPTAIAPDRGWRRPVLGAFHTCALDVDGALQCWGENDRGQLGQGDAERRFTPDPVFTP